MQLTRDLVLVRNAWIISSSTYQALLNAEDEDDEEESEGASDGHAGHDHAAGSGHRRRKLEAEGDPLLEEAAASGRKKRYAYADSKIASRQKMVERWRDQLPQHHAIRQRHIGNPPPKFTRDSAPTNGRRLSAAPAGMADPVNDEPGVHVRFRITKNIGDMSLIIALNDKPLRLILPYTVLGPNDAHVDEVVCNIDRYVAMSNTSSLAAVTAGDPNMNYYIAVYGGTTCAHYEVEVQTFTTSCAAAMNSRLRPSTTATVNHGSPGGRNARRTRPTVSYRFGIT